MLRLKPHPDAKLDRLDMYRTFVAIIAYAITKYNVLCTNQYNY